MLTDDQVERYRRDGWIHVAAVIEGAALAHTLALTESAVATAAGAGGRPEKIDMPHLRDPRWLEVARTPALVAAARRLLADDDVVLFASHLLCKPAGDGMPVPLHQDAEYWPLQPMEALSCWLALDRVDEENGAVRFLPGSHLAGPVAHEENPGPDAGKVLHLRIPESLRGRREFACAALSPGDCTFHHPYTLHFSPPNRSARRRAGLTLRYVPRRVRIAPGWPYDPAFFEVE
jgi:ectoine hydroxylase-related dioxygenase (phytanoyl-CoA dioxygenase family)